MTRDDEKYVRVFLPDPRACVILVGDGVDAKMGAELRGLFGSVGLGDVLKGLGEDVGAAPDWYE